MKLLFRFYDINSGLITIDNQDIAEVWILLLTFEIYLFFETISVSRWVYKVYDQEVQIRVSNATKNITNDISPLHQTSVMNISNPLLFKCADTGWFLFCLRVTSYPTIVSPIVSWNLTPTIPFVDLLNFFGSLVTPYSVPRSSLSVYSIANNCSTGPVSPVD